MLKKLLLPAIAIIAIYLGLNPDATSQFKIPDNLASSITSLLPGTSEGSPSASLSLPIDPAILGTASGWLQTQFSRAQDFTKQPIKLESLPEEIIIEDVVNQFSQQIQSIPQEQAMRIKAEFCSDVINTATATLSAQTQ